MFLTVLELLYYEFILTISFAVSLFLIILTFSGPFIIDILLVAYEKLSFSPLSSAEPDPLVPCAAEVPGMTETFFFDEQQKSML